MNTDIEELITEQMRLQAAESAWRPELLNGALRLRRRRRAKRGALAAGTTCVAAVVLVASVVASVPGGRPRAAAGPPQAETVAYVLHRVTSALAAAKTDTLEIKTNLNGWTFRLRIEFRPSGLIDLRFGASQGVLHEADWRWVVPWRMAHSRFWLVLLPPPGAQDNSPLMVQPFPTRLALSAVPGLGVTVPTPQNIRLELADGTFRLAGSQTVDGTRLLHLEGSARSDRSLSVWVSAANYLPVRSSYRITVDASGRIGSELLTSELTWVPVPKR